MNISQPGSGPCHGSPAATTPTASAADVLLGPPLDLHGEFYQTLLARIHRVLTPKTYFEIGTLHGDTLALSRCPSIAVDPEFQIRSPEIMAGVQDKSRLHLFQMSSDDFFRDHNPAAIFGCEVQLAFLDGMHQCEFLLRDFLNIERSCKPSSIVVLHDCFPVEESMADRDRQKNPFHPHHEGWWTGDVWRTALLLKRRRPDLRMLSLDAAPTGLVMITNLNPRNDDFAAGYDGLVDTMMSWRISDIGFDALFQEMGLEPAFMLGTDEGVLNQLQPFQ